MSNRSRWMFALVPVSALALVLGAALWTSNVNAADDKDTASLEGKAAPDVTLETMDGKPFKLAELKGKVVVMDFWATWCPPCRKSLPHVEELSKNKEMAEKGLKIFAVNSQEEKAQVEEFMKKNNYTFSVPMDKEGKAGTAYHVQGIPTTVVIGRDGKVKKVFVGFGPDSAKQLDAAIEEALKEKAPAA